MLFQKKRPSAGTPGLLKTKHQDGSLMVSQILAQSGQSNNSKNKNTIVASGIDTLELTIGGMVFPSQSYIDNYTLYDDVKSKYCVGDKYFTLQLGDRWFQLYPKSSGHYEYQFRNDEFGFIKVFHPNDWSKGCTYKQQIHLKLYSKFIHSCSETQLLQEIYKICSHFISDPEEAVIQISRADLHVDITNGDSFFSSADMDNVVTRTRFRDKWFDVSGVQFSSDELKFMDEYLNSTPSYNRGCGKLTDDLIRRMMLSSQNQLSLGADRLIGGRKLQTAYFGNPKVSDVYCRMYDKTEEVKKKGDELIQDIWKDNGYNMVDKVVRVEMSMKRNFIKELDNGSYVNLIDFMNNKHVIWEYMTHKFIRMVDSKKENNIQLSEVSSFWKIVQGAFRTPIKSTVRKKHYLAKVNQLYQQALGCIKQACSIGMENNEDYSFIISMNDAVKKGLTSSYHSGEILDRRKLLGVA